MTFDVGRNHWLLFGVSFFGFIGLAFIVPGVAGLLIVIAVQTAIVTSVGLFNPVYVTFRLQRIPPELTARVLAAWSIASSATIASATALWGVLAAVTSPRLAIAVAGVALACTSLLLRGWRADP